MQTNHDLAGMGRPSNPGRITDRRNLVQCSRALLATLFLTILATLHAAAQPLTLGQLEVVSETRVGRTVFEYRMGARLTNAGPAAFSIGAVLTSSSSHTVVTQDTLHFGDVDPGVDVTSPDSFVIRHDRRFPFDPSALQAVIRRPFIVARHTPTSNGGEVGVTVRPQVFFSKPVDSATLNSTNFYAIAAGTKLPATIVPSNDGSFAWLFLTDPMPSASLVQVIVDGSTIKRQGTDELLDAGDQGVAGSQLTYSFTTVSVTPIPGTVLAGIIVDPGADLTPFTPDDFDPGPDGIPLTPDDIYLEPIAGIKVTIVGLEENAVYTDANGRFRIDAVPSGDVKIVIDGRTATSSPDGSYFPEMVMDATMQVGTTNWVMPQMESVYMARVSTGALQTVIATNRTLITLDPSAAYNLPVEQQPFLTLEVPPNSLIGMDGQPLSSAQIGVSVVPPEIVRDMLPAGLLQHTFDITVQALGVATFTTPVRMTFPNVFGAAASPGSKLNFLSFDHTTGRLVIDGTATVSADGVSVTTDPGTGVTHPGWHGLLPPGAPAGGGGGGPGLPSNPTAPKDPKADCNKLWKLELSASLQCSAGLIGDVLLEGNPLIGCAANIGQGILGSVVDCNLDPDGCSRSMMENGLGSLLGCIPFWEIGTISDVVYGCLYQFSKAHQAREDCENGVAPAQLRSARVVVDPRLIAHNVFAEQAELVAAAADVYDVLFGSLKWCGASTASTDLRRVRQIFQALRDSTLSSGPGGQRITAEERAAIHLLPLPSRGIAADLDATLDRFDGIMGGTLQFSQAELARLSAAATKLVEVAKELQRRGWITTSDAFSRGFDDLGRDQDLAVQARGGITQTPLYYRLVNLQSGFVQRGLLKGGAQFDQIFLAANTHYSVEYFDPQTVRTGLTVFRTGPSGRKVTIPRAMLTADEDPDSDGDGLSDTAEAILGTNPSRRSTAGDGISDAAKVIQGLDPLARTFPLTGTIGALPLPGEAKEVVIAGSIANSQELTAYLALGSGGLAIVNVSRYQSPLLLGHLSLQGDAMDVAFDANLKTAVVAAKSGGLHLVDISEPMNPRLLKTINVAASQVEVVDGIAYVAVGFQLQSYDLLTGDALESLTLGGSDVTGLAKEGSYLYTMDRGSVLRVVDVSAANMTLRGSLTLPAGAGKISVGGGIAYVAAANQAFGGFATAAVADPDRLTLIAKSSATLTTASPFPVVAVNGSGLGLVLGGGQGTYTSLQVFNVADPANTSAFLTSFPLPADPYGLAIAEGIAFVADGASGLQIVSYLSLDNQGVAPGVAIASSGLDVDPTSAEIQVVEGSLVPIQVQVSDDVQVRNVELLVNGTVVQNAVTFPFDLRAAMPTLAEGSDTVTVQARATDTGGNSMLSTPISLKLVSDTMPPIIADLTPHDGSVHGPTFRSVTILFSEAMDASTVTAKNVVLSGASGTLLPVSVELRAGGKVAEFVYSRLDPDNYQILIKSSLLKDRAGNVLGDAQQSSSFSIREDAAVWTSPFGGFWELPGNWEGGVLPASTNDVIIDVPGNGMVTLRGTVSIQSLLSRNPFTLSGTLAVASTLEVDNAFLLRTGSTLAGATVVPGVGGASVSVEDGGQTTLDNVVLATDLIVPGGAVLYVTHGLTLSKGRLLVGREIFFRGTQSLLGDGEVLFGGEADLSVLGDGSQTGAATLTIGNRILIHGARGSASHVHGNSSFDGIINNGTIAADIPNSKVYVLSHVTNLGTFAGGAGELILANPSPNTGIIRANAGRAVSVIGNFTNAASGSVSLEIGGVDSGLSGRLDVSGTATLDGTLNLETVGGFIPTRGDSFQVLTFGSATRQFGRINSPALGNNNKFSPIYGATDLTLTVVDGGP